MPGGNVMVGGGLGMGPTAPMSNFPQTPSPASRGDATIGAGFNISDGTAARVALGLILVAGGLYLFNWAGYKFNVVSG